MTLRSIEVLKEVDLILAEDTRVSGRLLKHYDIDKPLRPYHAHNEHKLVATITAVLTTGQTAALISDAGMPGISDPGYLLVRACIDAGIEVNCLPGASAFVPALVLSGLPAHRFYFEGFLPLKKRKRKADQVPFSIS